MRNTIALITTLALILIAAPGLAKGPMTATITGPGIDEPIELFDQRQPGQVMHEHIVDLIEQTGLWYATPSLERIGPPGELGEPLMLHWGEEPTVIRQAIYLHAEGGPVIHTFEDQSALEGWGGDITGWFKAPAELVDTLRAFGVPTDAAATPSVSSPVLLIGALVLFIVIAARLVNSRLRPVVSTQ